MSEMQVQKIGYNKALGTYDLRVKGSPEDNEYVETERIYRMKNKQEAAEFIKMLKEDGLLKQPEHDMFVSGETGFAPRRKPMPNRTPKVPFLFPNGIIPGCDMPEQGGISGTMNKKAPKYPFVCTYA